jgi:hypothetical protein
MLALTNPFFVVADLFGAQGLLTRDPQSFTALPLILLNDALIYGQKPSNGPGIPSF